MLSYLVFFINEKLCRAEAFSGILSNFPKQKLAIIKLNKLSKILNKFGNLGSIFLKRLFPVQNRKRNIIIIEFDILELLYIQKIHLKQIILKFRSKYVRKEYFRCKTKKLESPSNSEYLN